MSEVFGLDFSALTDDQLAAKQYDLYARLDWASANGSAGLMGSLLRTLEAIEVEGRLRGDKAVWQARVAMLSEPIETDPEMAAAARKDGKPATEEAPAEKRISPRHRRSDNPHKTSPLNDMK